MSPARTATPEPLVSLSLRESFHVRATPERAWRFLIDPSQVVSCLPGAELTETVDARTYRGRVKVKVGPITTAYDGTAQLTEVDDAAHRMQLVGEGKEVGAAGSARMTMVGRVSANPEGGSLIEVEATIDIAGRVMQFGRGLIESVSRQLFKQFADAARLALEPESATGAEGAVGVPDALAGTSQRGADAGGARAPSAQTELRVAPLIWRALVDWVLRLLGRRSP